MSKYSVSGYHHELLFPQHRVVALSGPDGRRLFFNNPGMDVSQGYKILQGGAPRMEDIKETPDIVRSDYFKRLQFLFQKDRLVQSED